MAGGGAADKFYPLLTILRQGRRFGFRLSGGFMAGLALAMFIAIFAFGDQLLGWTDIGGKVQLGLFMCFLFGMVCGYRTAR